MKIAYCVFPCVVVSFRQLKKTQTHEGRKAKEMTNTTIFNQLIKGYNKHSFTHEYVFGFSYKGIIYSVETTNTCLPYVLTLDKASRGAGYSLRFKPTNEQKLYLLAMGAKAICSVELFKGMVAESIYNNGEIFEKLITEQAGQKWEKDNVPFYMGSDLSTDGHEYQIKFEKATFTNEKQMMKLNKRG